MAYLTLKNINKIYPNGYHAVHNFNLDIEKGEFIVFVGPSGCGKSTTLRMIAGLEDISNGDFLINGNRANEWGPRQREVAMVFQSYALYPQMTVFDNIAFGLTLQGVDEDVIEEKVNHTAAILGLTDYLDRLPRALSGGQRQRVAIGRALIRKVGVFLMDEPLSNLDAKQRVTMRSEIAQIGTPYELYYDPVNVFVAGFIGEPPMNFIRGTVTGGRIKFGDNELDLSKKLGSKIKDYEGKPIVFAFRPEHIELGKVNGAYQLTSMVELTEMLGDNTNVYVTAGEDKAILKVDPHDTPEIDEQITFSIPVESVYLFDGETEMVIK